MRILVIDDHPLIQQALTSALTALDPLCQVEVAGDLESGRCLIASAGKPDLVLLDLALPGYAGLGALRAFREAHPGLRVVVLSGSAGRDRVLPALKLGAAGFIPKSSASEVLLAAVRLVVSGGIYVPPEAVLDGSGPAAPPESEAGTRAARRPGAADLGLTERQAEVLALLLQGLPNKLICRKLALAEGTVKVHMRAILKALNASSRMEAVLAAHRLGFRIPDQGDATRPE